MVCSGSIINLTVVGSKTMTKAPLSSADRLRRSPPNDLDQPEYLAQRGKAMPSPHAPTSEPVATFSDSKKLGSTTVSDRLGNVQQQHALAKAHSRHIDGASRNARYRAVGSMTAGTANLRP